MIQGESGLAALNGGVGGEPCYVPMAVCDKICGYVLASAIGMALFHRQRTDEGQEVHVPMLETMVAFNLVDHLWNGVLAEPEKGLGYPRMLTPHRRPFPTKDGHVCILATTDLQSRHLFEALDCPELADDERFSTLARRTENIGELYEIVIERMRQRTTAEWRERLDSYDVPNGVVTDLEGLLADPYLAETGFFERVEHPSEGKMVTTAVPVMFSGTPVTASVCRRRASASIRGWCFANSAIPMPRSAASRLRYPQSGIDRVRRRVCTTHPRYARRSANDEHQGEGLCCRDL